VRYADIIAIWVEAFGVAQKLPHVDDAAFQAIEAGDSHCMPQIR
jgi:hypothetical protein